MGRCKGGGWAIRREVVVGNGVEEGGSVEAGGEEEGWGGEASVKRIDELNQDRILGQNSTKPNNP